MIRNSCICLFLFGNTIKLQIWLFILMQISTYEVSFVRKYSLLIEVYTCTKLFMYSTFYIAHPHSKTVVQTPPTLQLRVLSYVRIQLYGEKGRNMKPDGFGEVKLFIAWTDHTLLRFTKGKRAWGCCLNQINKDEQKRTPNSEFFPELELTEKTKKVNLTQSWNN